MSVQVFSGKGGARKIPVVIALLARGGFTWAIPASLTEFSAATHTRVQLDLSNVAEIRIGARFWGSVGPAGTRLYVQYSTDDATWNDFGSNKLAADSTGTKVTAWEAIPSGAIGSTIYLRVVGDNGNASNVQFDMIMVHLR